MKLVLFTAGTESTALLAHTINKYGIDNVTALTTVVSLESPASQHYIATEFFTKKICEVLGVKHIIARKEYLGNYKAGWYAMLQFIPDAYNVVLSDKTIDAVFVGAHSLDNHTSRHLLTGWSVFDSIMKLYRRNVRIDMPLKDIDKQQQYNSIPKNIKKYVWTCDFYQSRTSADGVTTGYIPCGECSKCKEFAQHVAMEE